MHGWNTKIQHKLPANTTLERLQLSVNQSSKDCYCGLEESFIEVNTSMIVYCVLNVVVVVVEFNLRASLA